MRFGDSDIFATGPMRKVWFKEQFELTLNPSRKVKWEFKSYANGPSSYMLDGEGAPQIPI